MQEIQEQGRDEITRFTLLQKNCDIDRLEDYSTWYQCSLLLFPYQNFSVVGQSSCVFIPALFLYFLQAHPYLWFILPENFYLFYVRIAKGFWSVSVLRQSAVFILELLLYTCILYVQNTISKLPNPYLRSSTVLLDTTDFTGEPTDKYNHSISLHSSNIS